MVGSILLCLQEMNLSVTQGTQWGFRSCSHSVLRPSDGAGIASSFFSGQDPPSSSVLNSAVVCQAPVSLVRAFRMFVMRCTQV